MELRQACRLLWKRPGFTAFSIISLALGFGGTSALFSAVHALLLKELPYAEPNRIVSLHTAGQDRQPRKVSLLELGDWQQRTRSFSAVAGYRRRSFGFGEPGGGGPDRVVETGMVTHGLAPALGALPTMGRFFTADEERDGARVIVLGDRLWRNELRGDPGVIGRTVLLNEVAHTVIGILPPSFDFPIRGVAPHAWIPISHADYGRSRSVRSLEAVARLAPDVTLEQARDELAAVAAAVAADHPDTNEGIGAGLAPLAETLSAHHRRPLWLLAGAAALLLLIACTNVANLQLELLLARRVEISVRSSLGATSARLARQFVTEAALLCVGGALAGLFVARACIDGLPAVLPLLGGVEPDTVQALALLRLNGVVLLLTASLLVSTTLVFASLALFVARRPSFVDALRRQGVATRQRTGLRGLLVAGQVALSLVLLVGAGLLLQSFLNVATTDPGFEPERVLRFGIGLPESRYDEPALARFHQRLTEQLETIPGVERAGGAFRSPLAGTLRTGFRRTEDPLPRKDWPQAQINIVGPGYFETLRVPLMAGRPFDWRDGPDMPRVLVVNEAFRRAWLETAAPLGERLQLGWRGALNPPGTIWEVVGIVGDVRRRSLDETAAPTIYLPLAQFPPEGAHYLVRVARDDPAVARAIPEAVHAIDPDLQRVEAEPLAATVRRSLGDRRLSLILAGAFATVALLLTLFGLYGLLAFIVTGRRRELAVRLALGARRRDLFGLVLGQGLRHVIAGVIVGVALAFLATPVLSSQLYGVAPGDPWVLTGVIALLTVVGLLAAYVPARRATRVDAAAVLKTD